MSRLYTLEDECLDYDQDYESVILVKEIDGQKKVNENEKDLQKQLSLQFYSKKTSVPIKSQKLNLIERIVTEQKENYQKRSLKPQQKQSSFKISTPSTKQNIGIIVTPKYTTKEYNLSKTTRSQITITPLNFKDSFKRIQLLVSQQQKHKIDFTKFKKSLY